jgi:hypothetical protein
MFFISYSRKDGANLAKLVRAKLSQAYLPSWLDEENLGLGDDWLQMIKSMVIECHAVLVVVTPEALKSNYVDYEWIGAEYIGKKIISVCIADNYIPETHILSRFQYHPIKDINDGEAWETLIAQLKKIKEESTIDPYVAQASLLLYSSNPDDRKKAQNYLINYQHPSASDALANAANSFSPEVSFESACALTRRNPTDYRVIPAYSKILKTTELSRFRVALENLNKIDSEEVVKLYKQTIDEISPEMEQWLIRDGLCNSNNPKIIPILLKVFRERKSNVNSYVVFKLGEFRVEEAIPDIIIQMLEHDDNKVIKFYAEALGKMAGIEAIEPLMELFVKYKGSRYQHGHEIYNSVCNALVQISLRNGLDEIRRIQSQHRDRSLFYEIDENIIQKFRKQ